MASEPPFSGSSDSAEDELDYPEEDDYFTAHIKKQNEAEMLFLEKNRLGVFDDTTSIVSPTCIVSLDLSNKCPDNADTMQLSIPKIVQTNSLKDGHGIDGLDRSGGKTQIKSTTPLIDQFDVMAKRAIDANNSSHIVRLDGSNDKKRTTHTTDMTELGRSMSGRSNVADQSSSSSLPQPMVRDRYENMARIDFNKNSNNNIYNRWTCCYGKL